MKAKPTNEELIEEFFANLRFRRLSEDTIEKYPLYVRALCKFNHGDTLLKVNEKILSSYLEHLLSSELKRPSISRYFSGLSTFYKFLVFKKFIKINPVTSVSAFYLGQYKAHDTKQRRQYLTIQQASRLVNSIYNTRDKALVILLLKTGIRTKDLSDLDVSFVNMATKTIQLKPTGKRSNETVFFDDETAYVLGKWLKLRERINKKGNPALFLNRYGGRLRKESIYEMFVKYAIALGLHDPKSNRLQDRLSPHCTRHFFTSQLIEAGCPRQYVKELRGDAGHDAIDIYTHIDKKKLQEAYEDCIPKLGII